MTVILPNNILQTNKGHQLAYRRIQGKTPGIIFLGGFMSDMMGTKAMFFESFCREHGLAYVRFDYLGHGASSGKFEQGSISHWTGDALDILDHLSLDQQILVGSSMGGWIMTLAALQRKSRIAGLLGIAAAPDFVESLIYQKLTDEQRQILNAQGICYITAEGYDKPYPITQQMIEDGKRNTILTAPINLPCPIRLVHGLNDTDVPWQFSQKLLDACQSSDATLTLVKDGDHRLSKAHELKILGDALLALL